MRTKDFGTSTHEFAKNREKLQKKANLASIGGKFQKINCADALTGPIDDDE